MGAKWLLNSFFLLLFLTACASGGSIDNGERGPIYIDSAELLVMESFPVQISLHLVGSLPTPCHRFQAEVDGPNAQNRIDVSVYTTVNPEMLCMQVLEPFDQSVSIPMDDAADGIYSVYVNGELVGEFTYPG